MLDNLLKELLVPVLSSTFLDADDTAPPSSETLVDGAETLVDGSETLKDGS